MLYDRAFTACTIDRSYQGSNAMKQKLIKVIESSKILALKINGTCSFIVLLPVLLQVANPWFKCMRRYLNVLLIGHWLLIGERVLRILVFLLAITQGRSMEKSGEAKASLCRYELFFFFSLNASACKVT